MKATSPSNGVLPDRVVGYVLGDRWTVQYEGSLAWHELFEEQEARLREEAERLGLPMDWQAPAEATPVRGGAEHEVWLGRDGRVYKLTKQDQTKAVALGIQILAHRSDFIKTRSQKLCGRDRWSRETSRFLPDCRFSTNSHSSEVREPTTS
jgi:hypothetical protein